jgi:SAM-dependent methyltransferase
VTAGAVTRRLERCLVCGGADLTRLPVRYEHEGVEYPLVACLGCGIRFLRVQPMGETLASLYAPAYIDRAFRCGRSAAASYDERAFVEENRGLLDSFERLGPRGRLLEVGSSMGWLLKHAAERGWRAQGVELSESAVAHARGLGLEVFQGELPAAGLPAAAFDLVYLGDVLEHVPDCRAVMEEIARVLAPGGHLVLRGPITTHSIARRLGMAGYELLGRDIVQREPPYHLWEFTPRSLLDLAGRAGLRKVSLTQSKIPPGRPHGEKSTLQRVAMVALDAVNVPITRTFNALGDRVVLVARKPG